MFGSFLIFFLITSQILLPLSQGNVLAEKKELGPVRKINDIVDLKLSSDSAVAVDFDSGKILYDKKMNKLRPIASVTKLLTSLVFLDEKPDFAKDFWLISQDQVEGGKIYVSLGEKLKVRDLFYASLVGSANNATLALVRSTGLSTKEFVEKMNDKAQSLGMKNSYFKEPTGLSEENVSTVQDLVLLAKAALSNQTIIKALMTDEYVFKTAAANEHKIKNTDKLISSEYFNILGGKTGYTEEAGYCLVTLGEVCGKKIITVVLGAVSAQDRFQDTKALYWWVEQNYEW